MELQYTWWELNNCLGGLSRVRAVKDLSTGLSRVKMYASFVCFYPYLSEGILPNTLFVLMRERRILRTKRVQSYQNKTNYVILSCQWNVVDLTE